MGGGEKRKKSALQPSRSSRKTYPMAVGHGRGKDRGHSRITSNARAGR